MKAILEFNLDEPDDKEAHMRAVKSLNIMLALWEYEKYLRGQLKYNEEGLTSEQYDVLDKARSKFYEILNENNISFDELLS